ncbi:transglutaminase domain-containing protein [Ancylomarina sp. 16SWW S1-10-2]|uniref:transglutaminase domain-containing protein n=1 Tax=Ancylomarina sp. 16SWW S1-10-2 TaxID=2499681 RepID=UPI0012AD5DE0|nr:transglutaminase domain-containing protein [Ancylomarina sp. 16SWW S1-10-2]MRT91445.1 hypothetical protein [Ancylomarina sp. 16SWW S1-10-2]
MVYNLNIKSIILIVFLCIPFSFSNAQEPAFGKYGSIDRQVKKTPDSLSNNILHLHQYLDSIGIDDEERIRAFYMWIITNIKYSDQVELLYDKHIYFYMGSNNCASPVCVFKKKKAVCEGFSNLFQFFCLQSGIEAYTIGGYISKNGVFQDRATHSWNAVKINNEWRFFDLTWAYANLEHYGIKRSTNEFYMVDPYEFVLSHIPLIPMWQFIETPVPLFVFNMGDEIINSFLEKKKPNYNYLDSLKQYKSLSTRDKCLKTANEIYKANASNKYNRAIEYYRYAFLILHYQSSLEDKSLEELDMARENILEAMRLFKTSNDVSSQIMFLKARDNSLVIQHWIQVLHNEKMKLRK